METSSENIKNDPGIIETGEQSEDSDEISILKLFEIISRHIWFIPIALFFTLLAADFYLSTATRTYLAESRLLLNPRKSPALSGKKSDPLQLRENLTVDSEIELIKSGVLLGRVAQNNNIYSDKNLQPLRRKAKKKKVHFDAATINKRNKILLFSAFRKRVSVKRVQQTYVVKISYKSSNRDNVAKVANAIAYTYLNDKMSARDKETKGMKNWLSKRIKALQQDVFKADMLVEAYKAKHGITDTSNSNLPERQESEISKKLLFAKVDAARVKENYLTLKSVLKQDKDLFAVADSLKSPVITKLRIQYSKAALRAMDFGTKYGRQHQAYLNARNEARRLNKLINGEMRRYLSSYQNNYKIAIAYENALKQSLIDLKENHISGNQKLVKFRELKQQLQTKKMLYQTILDKQQKWVQLETLPTVTARIIELATIPVSPISPKKNMIFLIAIIAGLAIGIGVIFLREMLRSSHKKKEQVQV